MTNTERAKYKRALLSAGKPTAGLSDIELEQQYYALHGEPLQNQQPAEEPELVEEVVEEPVETVAPETEPQTIEIGTSQPIVINLAAGAVLNLHVKAG